MSLSIESSRADIHDEIERVFALPAITTGIVNAAMSIHSKLATVLSELSFDAAHNFRYGGFQ
jgi:hypothetical protein